jgi:nitronate monooxygenase
MWPRTNLLELLGISHPIVQAPMGGFMTPALTAAVCNASGLGSIGYATLRAAAIREQVAAVRQATNRQFNLNFFVHAPAAGAVEVPARIRDRLARISRNSGSAPCPSPASPFRVSTRTRPELRPRVANFHFGLPSAAAVRWIEEAGCLIMSSATTVAEARALDAGGADVVIAQGFEAGGHRGSFSDSPRAGVVGTMALVPQIVDAERVPVIAAGGIADGRGIAAALALGAGGVQLGTAFLGCPEAAVPPLYRTRLRAGTDEATEMTSAFTGRPARAMRNRFVTEIADAEALEFPLQASLAGPLWQVPDEAARAQLMPFWAGQAVALVRALPAVQLVEQLAAEAQAGLARST